MGMSAFITVNDETIDAENTRDAYIYLRSNNAPEEKLNISFWAHEGYNPSCLVQIGYKDGTFKEYYIEQCEDEFGYIRSTHDHIINDMTNVLVVLVSITEPYLSKRWGTFDAKQIFVEEFKNEFLRSLT